MYLFIYSTCDIAIIDLKIHPWKHDVYSAVPPKSASEPTAIYVCIHLWHLRHGDYGPEGPPLET